MSDDITLLVEIEREMLEWRNDHLRRYLASGGADGHILDMGLAGGHNFTTTLLLKTVGRKSGEERLSPLIYGDIGGEVVIVGSKGGAPLHPGWYHNILAAEEVEFQVGCNAFRATWREPEGEERAKIWAFMEDVFPPYADYQSKTDRPIPLIMMKPVAEVPVFIA